MEQKWGRALPPSDGGDIAGERCFPIWERNFDCLRSGCWNIWINGLYPEKEKMITFYLYDIDDSRALSIMHFLWRNRLQIQVYILLNLNFGKHYEILLFLLFRENKSWGKLIMIMQVKTIHPLFQHQNIDIALFVNEKIFFISLSTLDNKNLRNFFTFGIGNAKVDLCIY